MIQKATDPLEINAVCYRKTHMGKRNRGKLDSENASWNALGKLLNLSVPVISKTEEIISS